jgi:hypothetical protein
MNIKKMFPTDQLLRGRKIFIRYHVNPFSHPCVHCMRVIPYNLVGHMFLFSACLSCKPRRRKKSAKPENLYLKKMQLLNVAEESLSGLKEVFCTFVLLDF